jgi:hypothetical protein
MEPGYEEDPKVVSAIRAEIYTSLAEHAPKTKGRARTIEDLYRRTLYNLNLRGPIAPGVEIGQFVDQYPDFGVDHALADLIRRELWYLFQQGIIAPGTSNRQILGTQQLQFLDLDLYVVTQYGFSVLDDFPNRIQVHDADGYLANFTNAIPEPDPVMLRYLSEAVLTFRDGHFFASVVLLASTSDRLLDVVADQIKRVKGGQWYTDTYRPNSNVTDRFSALTHKLSSDYKADLINNNLNDSLKTVVPPVFHLIRTARNDIAHPRGREFTRNEVNGFLHCFVGYYLCLNQIIGMLAALPDAP